MGLLAAMSKDDIESIDAEVLSELRQKILSDPLTKVNSDGSIDYHGNFNIHDYKDGVYSIDLASFSRIGLQFNDVFGDFICHGVSLRDMIGFPKQVNGELNISYNNIKSFETSPVKTVYRLDCSLNPLTSLKHMPTILTSSENVDMFGRIGYLNCSCCKLENLDGCQNELLQLNIAGNRFFRYLRSKSRLTVNTLYAAEIEFVPQFQSDHTALPVFELCEAFNVDSLYIVRNTFF